MEQRKAKLAVPTIDFIDKAVSIDPEFKRGDKNKRIHCLYKFKSRKQLAVRTRTRGSQDTAAAMLPETRLCRSMMISYHQRINNPKLLINMDETTIYLNYSPKSTVHSKVDCTVLIKLG